MNKIYERLSWILPKRLVYFCAIRLAVHATQGKWSKQIVPDLKVIDALNRWEE